MKSITKSAWCSNKRKKKKGPRSRDVVLQRKEWNGDGDITLAPIDEIAVPEDHPAPDPLLVAEIADNIRLFGLIHPIAVRSHPIALGNKTEIILVAGAARLAAHKLLGETRVPCTYFPDDELAAQFVRLSENVIRKNKTALQEADDIAELVRLMQKHQIGIFGQNVQNKGRPLSTAGKAAKQLTIPAKTPDARRKKIERALKISDGIYLGLRQLIVEKQLDDNEFCSVGNRGRRSA